MNVCLPLLLKKISDVKKKNLTEYKKNVENKEISLFYILFNGQKY